VRVDNSSASVVETLLKQTCASTLQRVARANRFKHDAQSSNCALTTQLPISMLAHRYAELLETHGRDWRRAFIFLDGADGQWDTFGVQGHSAQLGRRHSDRNSDLFFGAPGFG
jgi:hypothetical protein